MISTTMVLWKLDNGKALDVQELTLVVELLGRKSKKEIFAWAKRMNINPKNMKKSLELAIQ